MGIRSQKKICKEAKTRARYHGGHKWKGERGNLVREEVKITRVCPRSKIKGRPSFFKNSTTTGEGGGGEGTPMAFSGQEALDAENN